MPIGRPGLEAQIGAVPGFYASQSAQNAAKGDSLGSYTLLLDPDRWLPFKGLITGLRVIGSEGDRPVEPYLGFRRRLTDALAIGVVGFGSTKRTERYASYHGVRAGGEVMADVDLYTVSELLRIHAQGALAVTRILASGRYCVDDRGVGIDCSQDESDNTVISGKFVGVFPSGTAQLVFDFGRHQGAIHSVRVALLGSAGQMPLVLGGDENGTDLYYSFGITLAVAIGLGGPSGTE